MLKNLKVNENVVNANIHELFTFFNLAFFDNKLDIVILEWSTKMTLCAGICYYDVRSHINIIYREDCAQLDLAKTCLNSDPKKNCKRH